MPKLVQRFSIGMHQRVIIHVPTSDKLGKALERTAVIGRLIRRGGSLTGHRANASP
ncbi:MAG: hypothetical protein SOW28_00260 [Bifidobacterium mongoliense]|nr:hypothetical protein [Bifidobacterium mongoliense]MDY3125110.1 hypothetical protein [Bifidobacterium mongoliense]